MHGSKDKFNAKKLLGTPIDEIPVSDEDEEEEKAKVEFAEKESPSDSLSEESQWKQKQKNTKETPRQLDMMDSLEESKDEVAEDDPRMD